MQEQEFVEKINEIREQALISNVTLHSVELKFSKFADIGVIS
jgi:hypothetical protein